MAAFAKEQIVKAIAEETGLPKKQSAGLVETLLELIKDCLASGEDVLISGFGTFHVRSKKQRIGRNPATGKSMMLRPRTVVTFHASDLLREKLNP